MNQGVSWVDWIRGSAGLIESGDWDLELNPRGILADLSPENQKVIPTLRVNAVYWGLVELLAALKAALPNPSGFKGCRLKNHRLKSCNKIEMLTLSPCYLKGSRSTQWGNRGMMTGGLGVYPTPNSQNRKPPNFLYTNQTLRMTTPQIFCIQIKFLKPQNQNPKFFNDSKFLNPWNKNE